MASKSVADRWTTVKDGERVQSTRYGQGKRWRARYRDEAGREHACHFERKIKAQGWLDEVTASVVTGQYVDPRAGRLTFASWGMSGASVRSEQTALVRLLCRQRTV